MMKITRLFFPDRYTAVGGALIATATTPYQIAIPVALAMAIVTGYAGKLGQYVGVHAGLLAAGRVLGFSKSEIYEMYSNPESIRQNIRNATTFSQEIRGISYENFDAEYEWFKKRHFTRGAQTVLFAGFGGLFASFLAGTMAYMTLKPSITDLISTEANKLHITTSMAEPLPVASSRPVDLMQRRTLVSLSKL